MPTPARLRRLLVGTLGMGVAVALAACTAGEAVTPGERPNRPTTTAQPGYDPETDPDALAIPLDSLPSYRSGTPGADGWTSVPMTNSDGDVSWRLWDNDNQVIDSYTPERTVAFGAAQTYTEVPGVLTFRGNHQRTAPAYGTAGVTDRKLEIVWTQEIGEVYGDNSYWPGAGWTGQPLLVNWPGDVRRAMGFDAEFADKDLVEVVYPVFEGKVYRLDLETGRQTKPPIEAGCDRKSTRLNSSHRL